jgi:hypothetical protein
VGDQKIKMKSKLKQIVERILFLSELVLPYLWIIGFLLAVTKIVYRADSLDVNRYINPESFFILVSTVGILSIFNSSKIFRKINKLLLRINIILLIINAFFYTAFSYMEYTIWPNFVLSKFHIRLDYVLWSFVLLVIYVFVMLVKNVKTKPTIKLIYILLVFVLVSNLFKISLTYIRELKFMIKKPMATYEDKMKFKVGDFFINYIGFIKNNTEDNALIMIPPGSSYPWPQTGNGQYMYYFLYPRQVFSGLEKQPSKELTDGSVDYVLIAWGETEMTNRDYTHGWPKYDVPAEKIIYFLPDGTTKEVTGNYRFSDQPKNAWGIIKVKKAKR